MLDINNLLGFPIKAPQTSWLYMDMATGYGSTGNTTVRYSVTQKKFGSAITHVSDAVYGSSFVISEEGMYSVSANGEAGAALAVGITVNVPLSNLNADIISMSFATGRRAFSSFGTNNACVSITMRLNRGDIVRVQTNGTAPTNGERWFLNIAKVSE